MPSAFTTNAIAVKKVGTKVSVSVPAKVKQGKRPQVRVTAKAGAEEISGWAKVTVTGAGSHRVLVRRGYAAWKLPKLKAGKHKITVTFLATSTYSSSKATKKVTVKAAKPTKHKR